MSKQWHNDWSQASFPRPQCDEYTEMDINGSNVMTMCCWARSYSSVNTGFNRAIVAKWGSAWQYMLQILGTSQKFGFVVRDGSNFRNATSSSGYNDGIWRHIAGIFDGSNVRLKIDFADTEDITGDAGTTINNTSMVLRVSLISDSDDVFSRFHGDIERVGIWDRVLTNNELRVAAYLGPHRVSGAPPVLHFPLISGVQENWTPLTSKTAVSGGGLAHTQPGIGPPAPLLFA